MTRLRSVRRGTVAMAAVVAVSVSGCSFGGLNSLPLPGTVGHESGASTYHVEVANIGTLESNSPVFVSDVVVGSVGKMTVRDWHADIEITVQPGVVIPANAVATVGQTSLLGSMHLALNPPLGQPPTGRLAPGATLALNDTSTYPSTEQTLSALSVIVNGGGVGQIGDLIREFYSAINGRQDKIRDLLVRLNDFVGILATQRDSINASIESLNRLGGTFAGQNEVLSTALKRIPPALDVLVKERPRLVTALEKFNTFSTLASDLINDTKADLVKDLKDLEPTLKAFVDVGPKLDAAIAYAPTFPYPQNFIDRAIRGDYINQFLVFDFTIPRLKRTLFLGTRWGEEGAKLVPAPGDPWYARYTYDPLSAPFSPQPPTEVAPLPPLVDVPAPGVNPAPNASLTANTQPAPVGAAQPGAGTGPLPGPAPDAAPAAVDVVPADGGN